MSKSARWVFTVNNPGVYRPVYDAASMAYLVWQLEMGAQGTQHVQGYVRFKNAKTMAGAKAALVCTEAHLEVAKGTEEQCRDYCMKSDTRVGETFEAGTFEAAKGRQGSRSDIDGMLTTIKDTGNMLKVAEAHPREFLKFHGGIGKMLHLFGQKKAQEERTVHTTVLWGATGTGKSHRARNGKGVEEIYVVTAGRGAFDAYSGQKTIIFEEFDYNLWNVDRMKEYLDKWPMQLDCRFQNNWAMWDKVIILSNRDPAEWWWQNPSLPALWRRMQPPNGMIFHVESQEQEIDMTWWVDKAAPAAVPAAIPAITPLILMTPRIVTGDAQDHGGAGASTAPILARTDSVNLQDVVEISSDSEMGSDSEESQSN